MAIHLAGFGLVGPVLLFRLARTGQLEQRAALFVGLVFGAACGAGVALGIRFPNTTANIHSGYSFAAAIEWLELAATGGVAGAALGAVLAVRALTWRPAIALFLAFALAAVGWVVAAARPTIDCDSNESVCGSRYRHAAER